MPDPTEYNDKDEFMGVCVPKMMDEGKDNDQAVAACMGMWESKSVKVGARNNTGDRGRIRKVRQLANEIHGITIEIEPDDEDPAPEQPETIDMDKSLVAFGHEVKALGDGKVGGYLVRFSTQDDPDLTGDYFTKDTQFGTNRTPPLFYHHGMDGTIKTRIVGMGEWKADDIGLWYEAQLAMRDEYDQLLYQMVKDGKIGYSSGALSHLVEREQVGKAYWIKTWIIGEASLTPAPAEPRNAVIPLKSLSVNESQLEPDPEATAQADDTARRDEEELLAVKSTLRTGDNPATEDLTMDISEEKLQEMLDAGIEKALKALPANPPASNVTVAKDEADQPFASPGEYFKAVKNAALYPMSEDVRLRPMKATGMSEGVPADGGYLLNPQMQAGIMDRMYDVNSILGQCARDTVTGNSMLYNGVDETTHVGSLYGGLIGYWLGEASTITASKPVFYQMELKLKKIAALAYATDEQLEDTAFLGSWLARTVPNVLRWYVEEAIVNGDGVGKPLGIMSSPCLVTSNRDTSGSILLADIANMWSRRWRGGQNYVWLIEGGASAQLNQLTAATAPVYMPAGNMAGSPFGTLYGRPVIETEHCQALNTTGDIILADLGQYQTITKGDVQAASSVHVQFLTGETAFRFTFRIDGAPLWQSALTPVHGSNSVSPFVCLVSAST